MASLHHILADSSHDEGSSNAVVPPAPASVAVDVGATPTAPAPPSQPSSSFHDNNNNNDAQHTSRHDRPQTATGMSSAPAPLLESDQRPDAANIYTGNKMRHLKKEDGIPLWRKDIQYDFLRLVFYDQTKCFTKYSEKTTGFTFAEVYIDAMAKSSKCSKILREKLLSDTDGAISMAMVCLLVNLGRMNTTLNFFPEMRAQLRTYHSIPALQARQDPSAYKQLQDAPRLKSILKGATEDEPQPWTMEDIKAAAKPRTNAVNLIFVMSQHALKVSDMHFPAPRDFYDLIMRPTLSSESRARAFLWLLWWYLESDFTFEDSQRNPFGKGQFAEGEPSGIPDKVPPLESLTEEQADRENVDTEDEKAFGEQKRKERISILASEPSPAMVALKRARNHQKAGNRSDDEGSEAGWYKGTRPDDPRTRSPSPYGDMRIRTLLNADDSGDDTPRKRRPPRPKIKSEPSNNAWSRDSVKILPNPGPDHYDTPRVGLNTSSHHIHTPSFQSQRRHRGVTQHQSALNIHRRAQMDYMLDRSIRELHIEARRVRESQGSMQRAWRRMRVLSSDYDSEEESIKARKARDREKDEDHKSQKKDEELLEIDKRPRAYLAGFFDDGEGDIGEEVKSLASTFRKVCRRLERWQVDDFPGDALIRQKIRGSRINRRRLAPQSPPPPLSPPQVDVDMEDVDSEADR